ncbi:MAG: cbb3-type cytochrome c oxidase subunit 3 [Pseudomonadota bacterium]
METYETMRIFADSWGLLYMTLAFLAVVVMTLWPGSSRAHRDSADIPFRNEDRPIADRTPEEGDAS